MQTLTHTHTFAWARFSNVMRYTYEKQSHSLLYVCSTIRIELFVRLVHNNKIRVTEEISHTHTYWQHVWQFVACKIDVENGNEANTSDADVPCSRLRCETKATKKERKKKNRNQRKINDFQQNLLSINLSSEAVVNAVATAYLLQKLKLTPTKMACVRECAHPKKTQTIVQVFGSTAAIAILHFSFAGNAETHSCDVYLSQIVIREILLKCFCFCCVPKLAASEDRRV